MMRFIRTPIVLMSALWLYLLMGCSSDEGAATSTEEQQRQKLVRRWTVTSVRFNNVTQSEYQNFDLILAGSATGPFSYQAVSRPALSPWPASGTWAFDDDPLSQLVRDPASAQELNLSYTVSDTQLQLSFTFSGAGFASRSQDIQGQWEFVFSAQ